MVWYNPLTWFSTNSPEDAPSRPGDGLVLHRIIRDKKTGKPIACRPAMREVPLATRLTEDREFDCVDQEISVDEARAINGQPPAAEVIRVTAATAQAELRAKLEELGYTVEVVD